MTSSPSAGTTPSRFGAACWALAAPAFLTANVIIGLAWKNSRYSWATNNISDLGNIHCGTWDTSRPRYVCSPWHDAMNVSFLLTGVLLVLGLLLTWRRVGSGVTVRSAQVLLLASAVGWGMAGVFPA